MGTEGCDHPPIGPDARAYLAEVGYDADYGARAIQRELQDPLAVKRLSPLRNPPGNT